jgi:hypothetical protein
LAQRRPAGTVGAPIAAEEHQQRRLVRLQHVEAARHQIVSEHRDDRDRQRRPHRLRKEQADPEQQADEPDRDVDEAVLVAAGRSSADLHRHGTLLVVRLVADIVVAISE